MEFDNSPRPYIQLQHRLNVFKIIKYQSVINLDEIDQIIGPRSKITVDILISLSMRFCLTKEKTGI